AGLDVRECDAPAVERLPKPEREVGLAEVEVLGEARRPGERDDAPAALHVREQAVVDQVEDRLGGGRRGQGEEDEENCLHRWETGARYEEHTAGLPSPTP